ncbi:MAG: SRPBCC domain-containing protein [Terracidiphilus sp.]
MSYEISTEIEIGAPPSRVWEVLTDFPHYPDWNPFILAVKGDVYQGANIHYRFQFPRGIRIWTPANILTFDPDRELQWAAHFLSPAIFNGAHHFIIEPIDGTRIRFHHGEIFTGVFLPLLLPLLRKDGQQIYQSLNVALKQRVESLP